MREPTGLKLGHTTRQNAGMEITREQAGLLHEALFPHLNYLRRLFKRCAEVLPEGDPLRVAAERAYLAAWELNQEAHRRSVRMGAR